MNPDVIVQQYGLLGVLGLMLGIFALWAVMMTVCWIFFLWPASVVYWWTLRCFAGRHLVKPDVTGFGIVCGLGGWSFLTLLTCAVEHGTTLGRVLPPNLFWTLVVFIVGPAIYALLNQPKPEASSDARSSPTA